MNKAAKKSCVFVLFAAASLLAGCGNSPGPLEGTWRADGVLPMTVTFRAGETETLGVIEHVSYKTSGNSVVVTYADGMMKGASLKFDVLDANTVRNPMYTLRRVVPVRR